MQWRALILLFSGLAVVYIAILSQDTPYLHPKIIYTSNHPRLFKNEPDKLIISTIGSYIYVTAIKYEALKNRGSLLGTGHLKLGVHGSVKQIRKPIKNFLAEKNVLEPDGWSACFEHELNGPISKTSKRNSHEFDENESQFAILYHQVDNDNSRHYVRIYYTANQGNFEYKDILLPGSTWVNTISLENNSLIFSRDPDKYEFHIMTLPSTLTKEPHSTLTTDLTDYYIKHGKLASEWSQPYSTEQYSNLLSRLYSPVDETYRVFTLNVHKTSSTFYVNITIADNATITTSENKQATFWFQRDKGNSNYPVYSEENIEYVGFADISNYQNIHKPKKVNIPELHATVSSEAKTIVFPYVKNKFITLDYTDKIDILKRIKLEREKLYSNDGRKSIIPEYYYWQGYETVDGEILGIQINDKGDTLAVWTEYNYVYLYGRHNKTIDDNQQSIFNKIEKWFDSLVSDVSIEEKKLRDTHFPASWSLKMAIPPIKDNHGRSKAIGSVQFWKNEDEAKYIFVGLKDGNVNSYRIDQTEHHKSTNFWSFIEEKWDMFFAMCMVIVIFVYNEYQRP